MNPSDYPFPPRNLNQDIYNILWDIRTRVISIESRLTNIEDNVGPHPVAVHSISQPPAQQQRQPQQPHYQPHANAQQQQQQPQQDVQLQPQESISLAQYQQIEVENEAEEEREMVAQMYQLPDNAREFGDNDVIAKPKFTASKKTIVKNDIIVFLREEVKILEDDLDSMYEAFLQESRTHKQALEDAWGKNPKFFASYSSVPTTIKTTEVRKFETNIARMYKVRIGRCEKHWIADYFIHSVYNSIKDDRKKGGNRSSTGASTLLGNMGLSRQNSQATLRHQESSSSMTSLVMDNTDTVTEEQSPSLPPTSYISSTPTPTPSSSYQQQMPPPQPQPQPTFSVSFMSPPDPTSPPPQQITRARKRLASPSSSSQPPRNPHPRNNNQ
ncbi:hypothetical protein INT45_010938 [Circinella minor]|uniref:Uncharacterized protein n=1 Tax=Circinella minor TaxID=1195481 RepID=A0A8H7RP75_9FUNG|nr:hypothetical protein INT45_010938 [Circinella minor]